MGFKLTLLWLFVGVVTNVCSYLTGRQHERRVQLRLPSRGDES